MIEERASKFIADGGSVEQVEEITGLDFATVNPDMVAVDPMNERTQETLDTEELEQSIKENGIVEPPVCRLINKDAKVPYGVIQGQRRITAAQRIGLEEVPILIGEFDDLEALTRSITENIAATSQDVHPNSRAAAIWQWWVLWNQDRGDEFDKDKRPDPTLVGQKFGVHRDTASTWVEHLTSAFSGTKLDPRVNFIPDETGGPQDSVEVQGISPSILKDVRRMGFQSEEAVEVVEKVQKNALTRDELRKVKSIKKNPDLSMSVGEAIETQVEARKEAQKAKQKFMLKAIHMTGSNAQGLRAAESDLGKPREEVVKIAVEDFLDRRGYL